MAIACTVATTLAFMLVSVLGEHTFDSSNEKSDSEENLRIIGGMDAEEGQFPYAVAMYFADQFICTASILSPNTILTAAHCMIQNGQQLPTELFSAVFGTVNRTSSNATVRSISRVVVHPNFEETSLRNDIAVLTVSDPIVFSDRIGSIALAGSDTGRYRYLAVTAMGWGRNDRFSNSVPDILQYVDQKIALQITCNLRYGGGISSRQICVEGLGRGICSGDSGGPLAHVGDSEPVQVGITSFINGRIGCASVVLGPAVFTWVPPYSQWVIDASGDSNIRTI